MRFPDKLVAWRTQVWTRPSWSTNLTSRQDATRACIRNLGAGRCHGPHPGATVAPRSGIIFGNELRKHRLGPCRLLVVNAYGGRLCVLRSWL